MKKITQQSIMVLIDDYADAMWDRAKAEDVSMRELGVLSDEADGARTSVEQALERYREQIIDQVEARLAGKD